MSLEKSGEKTTISAVIGDLEEKKRQTGHMFAQPVRVQPTREMLGNENVQHYLVSITKDEVAKWPCDKVFMDTKYAGVRAVLVIDKSNRSVKILSRTGSDKTYEKFVGKYKDKLVDGIDWRSAKGDLILDGELYVVTKKGHRTIAQGRVTGFARDPKAEPGLEPRLEVFDAIMVNQYDVRDLPLQTRKKLIKKTVDEEGGVVKIADTVFEPKSEIGSRFTKISKKKEEGLVIKDPSQEYLSMKGGELRWRKVKMADSLDLELRRAEAWPRGKKFRFYKHLYLVPSDNEDHEIQADKGVQNAGLDYDFWTQKTKEWLNLYARGIVEARGNQMVECSPEAAKIYGRKRVPKVLYFPKHHREVVEIFAEDMTDKLIPAGQKIVGFRDDKNIGDTMDDIRSLKETFGRK
jgi:ATP-dependent DNA ligase